MKVETTDWPFADLALGRRLERAEAQSNIEFVEARARAFPESGACWLETAGAHGMFDGVDSPLTQTFGLGMTQAVTASDMESFEAFFGRVGAPVFHEVSPLADASALMQLNGRGYEPFEFTSVMFRPIDPSFSVEGPRSDSVTARRVGPEDMELWAQTMSRGWGEDESVGAFMLTFSRVSALRTSGFSFLAEAGGKPIAAGGLTIHAGVAMLAGASTVPEARRQGAQSALLEARLRFGAEQGCDIAMICALPGSPSQRNAERKGFRIAYTRVKWRKKPGS